MNVQRWIVVAGAALAAVGILMEAASGSGHRFGWWDFRDGFALLRYGVYVSLAAAGVLAIGGIVAAVQTRWRLLALAALGLVMSGAAALLPISHRHFVGDPPVIHDISTDLDDPPAFVAVLPLRKNALNPAAYGGPEVAAEQRRAYPDIKPLDLALPPSEAFRRAEQAARAIGWEIVTVVPAEGRIEATARTFWFRFADDVVIRVRARDGGSRVDVRSVSRVGRGDLGANARRVRAYLGRVAAG
ncbi:MAG: DUF1499 domain-containing protein [Rhodospirillales bacterium]|nr:DUF1499 domain-containing protein [Rhodospirillales bacterium]